MADAEMRRKRKDNPPPCLLILCTYCTVVQVQYSRPMRVGASCALLLQYTQTLSSSSCISWVPRAVPNWSHSYPLHSLPFFLAPNSYQTFTHTRHNIRSLFNHAPIFKRRKRKRKDISSGWIIELNCGTQPSHHHHLPACPSAKKSQLVVVEHSANSLRHFHFIIEQCRRRRRIAAGIVAGWMSLSASSSFSSSYSSVSHKIRY